MLRDSIGDDMRAAMKARESVRVSTLRMLMTSMKNAQVEAGHELEDDEVLAVVVKEAKRRKESIEAYTDAARPDLAEKEQAELVILESYLPEQMSDDELASVVDAAIVEAGASDVRQMGAVMKLVMAKVANRADGKAVSAMVKSRLSG